MNTKHTKIPNKTVDVLQEVAKKIGLNPMDNKDIKRLKAVIDGRGIHFKESLMNAHELPTEFVEKDDDTVIDDYGTPQLSLRFAYLGSIKPKGSKLYTRPPVVNRGSSKVIKSEQPVSS